MATRDGLLWYGGGQRRSAQHFLMQFGHRDLGILRMGSRASCVEEDASPESGAGVLVNAEMDMVNELNS